MLQGIEPVTPKGAMDIGVNLAMALAGPKFVPKGARSTKLPMDEASRMARAKEGGFADAISYHGASRDFSAFDRSKRGATAGAAPAREGEFSAFDPEIAAEFSHLAAKGSGGNAQIYPLRHRSEKQGRIHLTGDELNHEIASTLNLAWDNGFDSVVLKNYTSPGGRKGDILVVKNPNQLRSPYAAFDPRKRDSANLLAGIGAVGAIPAAALTGREFENDEIASVVRARGR